MVHRDAWGGLPDMTTPDKTFETRVPAMPIAISGIYLAFFMVMALAGANFFGNSALGATKPIKVSVQYAAFAPNAGGQIAYGLRAHRNNREIAIFQNHYLTAGDEPLLGALYAMRFPLCDESCMVHIHVQGGLGATSAGPLVEFLWGTEVPLLPLALNGGTIRYVPMLRFDIASHWMATRSRLITWSYPFWIGVTLPF